MIMNVKLVEVCCCKCNISFWITAQHNNELIRCHSWFCCPNGHSQYHVSKTNVEKAKEERDRYKQQYNQEKETSGRLARSNAALRGVITKNKL